MLPDFGTAAAVEATVDQALVVGEGVLRLLRTVRQAGQRFANGFFRDSNGRLRDAGGRFAKEGTRAGEAYGGGLAGGTAWPRPVPQGGLAAPS